MAKSDVTYTHLLCVAGEVGDGETSDTEDGLYAITLQGIDHEVHTIGKRGVVSDIVHIRKEGPPLTPPKEGDSIFRGEIRRGRLRISNRFNNIFERRVMLSKAKHLAKSLRGILRFTQDDNALGFPSHPSSGGDGGGRYTTFLLRNAAISSEV